MAEKTVKIKTTLEVIIKWGGWIVATLQAMLTSLPLL